MCGISKRVVVYFSDGMILKLLVFVCSVKLCFGVRLNPLENNDKLQDINNLYVAEWQWESWPIKQEPSEQDNRSPGPRANVALWKDTSGPTWYLFGGHPIDTESKKIYSDVWKYSVETRVWERFFPPQSEIKGANIAKIGGMMTLRANLFDDTHTFNSKTRDYNIVLCGGVTKLNSTKIKKTNIWNNFTRKKKEEEKRKNELKSLAVYAPKTSKSNTVWQIDVKDKLWTAYVCCCDNTNGRKENLTLKLLKPIRNVNDTKIETSTKNLKMDKNSKSEKNESVAVNNNIKKIEDEVDNEQQHWNISNLKTRKKINQSKKLSDNLYKKTKIEKRETQTSNATQESTSEQKVQIETTTTTLIKRNDTDRRVKAKKEKYNLKIKEMIKLNKSENQEMLKNVNKTEKSGKTEKTKTSSKYCPEFSENGQPVTWCDGDSEVLITADVNTPQITLWIFNLKTSHWSQQQVKISDDIEWPGCSAKNSIRYAGNENEVYLICSPVGTQSYDIMQSQKNLTNSSKNPSDDTVKIVYRINYKQRFLESLGEIRLSSFFSSPEGQEVWKNESKLILQIIKTAENRSVLLLAYLDCFDLWILYKDQQGREYFDLIEKIWRGSALKWFNKYNAPLYNLRFISDSGNSETILIPNPRPITLGDYWPRERGRFIIRIFKNENLKNQSFENRTREQNLTYELLQSDYKPPSTESQLSHAYSLKVLVFFGISLAIFTVFGFFVFLKRCVSCPPKIRTRSECHKSPLVIRYSVIPDDLLYPVA